MYKIESNFKNTCKFIPKHIMEGEFTSVGAAIPYAIEWTDDPEHQEVRIVNMRTGVTELKTTELSYDQ